MILVKVGGGKKINLDYVCEDFAILVKKEKAILIHGGAAKRDEIAEKLGHPSRIITSPSGFTSVYTDEKALEIFLMVYAGLVNKKIVAKLQSLGVNAIGLCGIDGRLFEGKRKSKILAKEGKKIKLISGDFSGKVEKVNFNLIKILLKNGFFPVICPPAISYQNEIINVDSDLALAQIAKELKPEKVVILMEAAGFLENPENERSLISNIKKSEIEKYLNLARGRMKKKMLAIKQMISFGIEKIYLGDGRVKNPIFSALEGKGTIIK